MKLLPAKALITEAVLHMPDLVWTLPQVRSALTIADAMFGLKRRASVAQATIAERQGCHRTRVVEHLQVLCRRPEEAHDVTRHLFIRTYRSVPQRGGHRHKVAVFTIAPEFEAAVLTAREQKSAAAGHSKMPTEVPGRRTFGDAAEVPNGQDIHTTERMSGPPQGECPEQGERMSDTGGQESGNTESGNNLNQATERKPSLKVLLGRLDDATSVDRLLRSRPAPARRRDGGDVA